MMTATDDFWGEPISTYTASQAIEDGLFVEASPDTHANCLLTRPVFERILEVEGFTEDDVGGLRYRQRVVPLLMDAALIVQADPDEWLYTKGLQGDLTSKTLWIARNELGGLTIMFPEDY
ncbi:MAG: hypothetical protein JSU86_11030 [Phycisphaerales bacterium]|nr:MAG: hypothetical protein JSU86_11030 [Phycisphaerales bacterium]